MKFTLILLILINSLISFSQSQGLESKIISFELSNTIEYHPGYYNGTKIEYEIFKFHDDCLKHKYSKSKKDKIRCANKHYKRITSDYERHINEAVNFFINNCDNMVYSVKLDQTDMDSLIALLKDEKVSGFSSNKISIDDLTKYIKNDTINIVVNDYNSSFQKSTDSQYTEIIDPFRITLKVNWLDGSSKKYEYSGNLSNGVELTKINYFLLLYQIHQTEKIFLYTTIDNYFTKENLYLVILRYIAYKEDKREKITEFEY